jgi:cell division protein FtsN
MTGEERGNVKGASCDAVEGGYTIFLDEERIRTFMGSGDYSSASEISHFKDVGAQIEKRIKDHGGAAFLALSIGEKGLSRDFAVLEIAHILAQHGKSVLIVDCDFLHPGMSGLIENVEEHGFLDLLLYGSSLKSVARSIGVEGVSVMGAGSFPVSRTIPFALKEFEKIREFLRAKHDVVIYCSTLYTEDAKVNPLAGLVDGVVLCCRIEDMPEGELQKNLKSLGAEKVSPIELVCFCAKREQAQAAAPARAVEAQPEAPKLVIEGPLHGEEEMLAAPVIEKTEELGPPDTHEAKRRSVSMIRIVSISAGILIVAFVVWWAMINRTVRENESRGTTSLNVTGAESVGTAMQESAPPAAGAESLGAAAVTSAVSGAAPGEAGSETGAPAAPTGAKTPTVGRTGGEAPQTQAPAGPPQYTIHVASFKEMSRAEIEKAYLEQNGFPARIIEVDIRGEKWLRVLVGEYATMEQASKARLDLLGLSKIGYARITAIGSASR